MHITRTRWVSAVVVILAAGLVIGGMTLYRGIHERSTATVAVPSATNGSAPQSAGAWLRPASASVRSERSAVPLAGAERTKKEITDALSTELKPFNEWLAEYLAAPDAQKAALLSKGLELAAARRAVMARLIENDPRRALENAVPSSVASQLPAAIASKLERFVEGEGKFDVYAATGAGDGQKPLMRFLTVNKARYEAFVYGARSGQISTADAVPVHGIALDAEFAVDESSVRVLAANEELDGNIPLGNPSLRCPVTGKQIAGTLEEATKIGVRVVAGKHAYILSSPQQVNAFEQQIAARAAPGGGKLSPIGNKSLIAYIVDFPDKPGTPLADPVGHYNEVDRLYQDMSYGMTRMQPITVTPLLRLPGTAASYEAMDKAQKYTGSDKLLADARAAATAAGFKPDNFDMDEVYFAKIGGAISYGGLGSVGRKGSWNQATGPVTSTHELGHNFGLGHGSSFVTTDGNPISPAGQRDEYGDVFEVMGSAGDDGFMNTVNFNAWYKSMMGYVPFNEIQTVTASGTYRIFGLEYVIGSGLHALKLRKDDTRDYWVEFRPRITHNPNSFNGANLHFGYKSMGDNSDLLDMTPGSSGGFQDAGLAIGRTYADAAAQLYITPIGKGGTTPESLDVVVNVGTFATNRPPVVAVAASTTTPGQGEVVKFTATASDPDNDTLAYYWDFGSAAGNAAGSTNSATVNQSLPDPSKAYVVSCTVTDMKGGTATASVTVNTGATFTGGAPTVVSISPVSGPNTGRTAVTLTGTNFQQNANTAITFGGVAALNIQVVNSTTLTCTTPPGTAGAADVVVTHNNAPAITLAGAFIYLGAPTIASLAPAMGPQRGNTTVTITGTNFVVGQTSFRFGLTGALNVNVVSPTTATCVAPNANAGGVVDVSVAVGIPSATLPASYTYVAAPTVASLAPSAGTTAGGSTVTITGTQFAAGATVNFGTLAATNVVVNNPTTITCTTPAAPVGAVDINVTSNAQLGTLPGGFTYADTPTITNLVPNVASTTGTVRIFMDGTGFLPNATVTVGGTAAANVAVRNAMRIEFDSPVLTAGSKNVVVTLGGGVSSLPSTLMYVVPPGPVTYTDGSPLTGPASGGTLVTINGGGFVPGATVVLFDNTPGTNVNVVNAGQVTCLSPASATATAFMTVNVFGTGPGVGNTFTFTGPTQPTATVMNMTPAGAAFYGIPQIGVNAAVTTTTARIQFDKPVLVDTTLQYTVSGTAEPGRDYVPLSGSAVVKAGNSFVDIEIVPLNDGLPQGNETLVITLDPGASFKVGAAFSVSVVILAHDLPTIDSVFPETGTTFGEDLIEISGSNFLPDDVVTFGGVMASEIEVLDSTLIVCRAPANAAGPADVAVVQPKFNATLTKGYLYIAAPTADMITPYFGPITGGTPVTITGTNFVAGAEVEIDGTPCTNIKVLNSTTITCVTPPGFEGAQSVAVFINDIPAVIVEGFEYLTAPPKITSPLTASGVKGQPFTYTIVSDTVPSSFTAANLPPGLNLLGAIISGTPTVAGVARITVTATAGTGSDTEVLVLTITPGSDNTAPVLTSIFARPNPALVGAPVQFFAAATDAQGDLLDFNWTFGDGSATANGASVSHTFASAGIYKANVVVTDGAASDSRTVFVAVNAAAPTQSNRFSVRKAAVNFTFPTAANDSLSFSGSVPVAGTVKNVTIAVGGFSQSMTLTNAGQFTSADKTVQFKLSKAKNGVSAYKLTVKNVALFPSLQELGFTNQPIAAPGIVVPLPVLIAVDGLSYASSETLLYTVKGGKGTAK